MQAAAAKAVGKLEAIQEVVKAQGSAAAGEMLALPCAPPLTWNILRALLLVLGKPSQAVDTWLKCRYCTAPRLALQLLLLVLYRATLNDWTPQTSCCKLLLLFHVPCSQCTSHWLPVVDLLQMRNMPA